MELGGIWLDFLASPAAPRQALSLLALEGYLTGVLVAPRPPIPPSLWIAGLWQNDEPVFDDDKQAASVLGALMARHDTLAAEIDASLARMELYQPCDYRPAFLTGEAKPDHASIREWVGGFWKAMTFAPEAWNALATDDRLQPIFSPFAGFIELDSAFEPADDIEARLDQAAGEIPRAILIFRKIAHMRAGDDAKPPLPVRRTKIGRNDPCPCGSGLKYKRCCGRD